MSFAGWMSYFSMNRHVGTQIKSVKSRLATCGYCRLTLVTWGITAYRVRRWGASKNHSFFHMYDLNLRG